MRRSLWAIPPLLGIVGYLAAGAGQPREGEPPLANQPAGRPKGPGRADVAAVIGELEQAVEAERNKGTAELGKSTPEALRETILKLKQRLAARVESRDWTASQELESQLYAAAKELGKRQGAEGIAWLQEMAPDQCAFAMDGWAEVEPDAAFKAIIASDRRGPCATDTLMTLLQGKAREGSASLKQACAQMPWELFRDLPGDPFSENELWIPEDADIQSWVQSGAPRELAAQGVALTNLFSLWAKQDPREALIQSLDWPGEVGPQILFVLGQGLDSPDRANQIRTVLESLPEDQLSRVREAFSKHREKQAPIGDQVLEAFPILQTAQEGEESR